ncbi:Hypothetical protein, putative [Bodo saltans]|nr:Hypothetical protein, putative [Bodo saltans]|eukprot:CUG91913.1 Hypothetical protein, putative [Bodo saltans]
MAMETKIVHALGGSWEGLLQEKWHRSWEAVNVVEVWVLPTAAIRNEYNELSRNLQATILNTARVNQMKDLELESVPSTKLPPMSFYRSGSQATGNGNASDGESSRRMSQSRKGRGKAQFKLGATANVNTTESVDSSFVFDNESMTESIQLDQNPRGRHKSKARSQQQAKLLTSDSADLPNGADHTTADGVVPAASTITHKPQPPTKSQSPSKSVKKSKSSEEKQKVKKNPGLVHSGSIAMFEEDDQLAIMRKLAQERNDRQQALRSLPLEEVIRRETKRMAKGDHRHQLSLPPLLTREDVMYFHRGGEGEEPQVALGKPSPRMQAPPLAIPPDADDEETMMRRQLLFGGHEKLDEAGLMQQDRVIRVPKPPASATTTALQLPLTAGRGHKKPPMWDDAASPLPSGLMLMLKHNGTGTSARQLNPNQRSSSPQKIGVARGMPPTSASASQVSSPRATASAAVGKVRRWFQHIPETAPTMKCSSLDRKFQGTEPFDVMLVQMLRMAEDAGVLKQQQAGGTFKMTSSPRTNGTYS